MNFSKSSLSLLTAAAVLVVAFATTLTAQQKHPQPGEFRDPKVDIAWNRLYDYPELMALLRKLHDAYPELTSLESLGKSSEGRDMMMLTINNPKTGADTQKPAMWVDANVHGNEVQGGEACLYLAWYVLEHYGRTPSITELLDRKAFYILPSVNPDGRAWWFQGLNTTSSSRSGKKPTDNDGDGLFDEDGYDDLDGDGEVLEMRKRDPYGDYKTSPDDPRMMVRVPPGEHGEWRRLGREGIDNDGDGRVNEDGPGGYDMNRNWGAGWQATYIQRGAGEYPFSYPEAQCVAEFIIDHPNIAAVQSFHNAGGMILRGPGSQFYGTYPRGDISVYDELGKIGEKMLPFYRYMILWKDLYTVHGGFVTWTYEGLGIISFTNELWSNRRQFPSQQGSDPKDRFLFNDRLRSGMDFVEYKPFKHPTYGDIEIGGWRKTTGRTPPSFLIEEGSHRNALFCIYHATEMPEIAFLPLATKDLGDGRTQIDVMVKNDRRIPSVTALSKAKRIGLPDLLEFKGALKVVFSGTVQGTEPDRITPVRHRPQRVLNWDGVHHRRPYHVRFIVEGKGKFTLSYRSQKGGTLKTSGEVK